MQRQHTRRYFTQKCYQEAQIGELEILVFPFVSLFLCDMEQGMIYFYQDDRLFGENPCHA